VVDHVRGRCADQEEEAERHVRPDRNHSGHAIGSERAEENAADHRYELPRELVRAEPQVLGHEDRRRRDVQKKPREVERCHACLQLKVE
jgi:hypothetical protein